MHQNERINGVFGELEGAKWVICSLGVRSGVVREECGLSKSAFASRMPTSQNRDVGHPAS